MKKLLASALIIAAAAYARAARPLDPYSGLDKIAPSVTNLAAHLVLPDFVQEGSTARGVVAYSNLLSTAVLDAPAFMVAVDGEPLPVASATAPLMPNASGEVEFSYIAGASHTVTLSMMDANAPARLESIQDEENAQQSPAYAAVLPVGPAPLSTRFIALGKRKATSYLWEFDDGSQSTAASPVHTFSEVGAHAVTLTLGYENGESERVTIQDAVTVWDAPDAIVRIVPASIVSNTFSVALGDAVDLDIALTNDLVFAFAADVRTVGGIRKVRRFYGGIAGEFGTDIQTSLATPDGLLSKEIDATVDFGTPPLLAWAGPKVTASATIGADLALHAKGRFVRGVRFDGERPYHVGGAVLEEHDVSCPRLFLDATVFAGLELGAAFGVSSPLGTVSGTLFSLTASAGVRGDVAAEATDVSRRLDATLRPVVEVEFVPVSVTLFDVVDFTPVVKSKTLYEGPAREFHFAADGMGELLLQTLPVAAGFNGLLPDVEVDAALASPWLAQKHLVPRHATSSDAASILRRASGKHGADGHPLTIWDDFVSGTNPTDHADRFAASITIGADGRPQFTWSPDLGDARTYTIYGTDALGGEWHTPPTDSDRFFKVEVDVK
ncbi:MAG: PKD domain-containing protein [Kiritimatiellae bacterium]|nr:PKD domain-containing protein [Kiritimatiellia bacterium]